MQLTEFSEGQFWTADYPVRYAGCTFNARMSVVRLDDGKLMLHSPCAIDDEAAVAISRPSIGSGGETSAPPAPR